MTEHAKIRQVILAVLKERGASKTACPSEVARSVYRADAWREKMPLVREVSSELAKEGLIEICQNGRVVDPYKYLGPIRLRLK